VIQISRRQYALGCIVWEITLKCNMKCIHCGSSAGKTREEEMTTDESLELCGDLAKIGCKGIGLIGGELFLRNDWFEIASEIKNLGMQLSIVSNGFLIDEKLASKISKLEPDSVGISIDGSNAKTHDYIRRVNGSFERAVNALKFLKNQNIPTSIITTVHKLNFKELPEIKNLILKKDIAWQIQIASPFGRFKQKYSLSQKEFYSVGLFIASLKNKYRMEDLPVAGAHNLGYYSRVMPNLQLQEWQGCQAGITNLGIQSNGNVKGCLSLPDEFVETNVKKKNIMDVWNDPNAFAYNRNFKKASLAGFCRGCIHSMTCKGGCLSMAYNFNKRRENTFCFYRIESVGIK